MNRGIFNPPNPSRTGTYDGNDTANRAIPHGLGRIPTLVTIAYGSIVYFIFPAHGYIIGATGTARAATAPTSSNFYVGNAGEYTQSANHTGNLYYWTAI